eukprot:TRINITY_DN6989_c2_g4_i1.p1 TRINITY_DN6989_c2_g4~~TRINITY_DN6989_c2_g4_i1.p1  ORF type:complete len:738 (-),score=156.14 TRINITY_DN6989_c2_g4_i1:55-2268(-)
MAATGKETQNSATLLTAQKQTAKAEKNQKKALSSVEEDAKVFFGCGYCSQVFFERGELESHIQYWHSGATYRCVEAALPERMTQLLHQPQSSSISVGIPLTEIARHNTPDDCWVAIDGKVYDLTEFLGRHPGGKATILAWAGKDATKFFNEIHQTSWIQQYLRPEALLGEVLATDGNDSYDGLMSDSYWHKLREARITEVRHELLDLVSNLPGNANDTQDSHPAANDQTVSFGCAYCSKVFKEKTALEAHIRDDHKGAEYCCMKNAPMAFRHLGADSNIPLSEVAKHNSSLDCWVAFNGKVFDLTFSLKRSPEGRNAILAWAGRDATAMWDRIPGRFPSAAWVEQNIRPEQLMGKVGKEKTLTAQETLIRELQLELKRLEGPSETARKAAAEALAARGSEPLPMAVAGTSELERFPGLKEAQASKGKLPQYTRQEVSKHGQGPEPWMIIHNKVYDLNHLIGYHPGGDDIVLAKAGTDATKEFEIFEHSEKARMQRDKYCLIGELVPQDYKDWAAESAAAAENGGSSSVLDLSLRSTFKIWARMKLADATLALIGMYIYHAVKNRKPLSKFGYSRGLRHLHALMAIGIFGSLGAVHAAARSEGADKKFYLKLHKQSGMAVLVAVLVRIALRMKSGIPPRFPGHPVMQFIETQSLRAFYAFAMVLPISGMTFDYFTYYTEAETDEEEKQNDKIAKTAIDSHKLIGKIFEYAWLPFHLGYTTAYHYSKGRGVVRKVNPFL